MQEINFSLLDEILLMHKCAWSKVATRATTTIATVYRLDEDDFILKVQKEDNHGSAERTRYYRGGHVDRDGRLSDYQFDPNTSNWQTK